MPLVKPMTMLTGMNRMSPPMRSRPIANSSTPAASVQIDQVGNAVARDDAVHHNDVRAGGSADLHARSAERGDDEAGEIAV